jgi:glycosyltransferase involved in cell wall biosynthesis
MHKISELGLHHHALSAYVRFLSVASTTKKLDSAAQLVGNTGISADIVDSQTSVSQELRRLLAETDSGLGHLVLTAYGLNQEPGIIAAAMPATTDDPDMSSPRHPEITPRATGVTSLETAAVRKMPIVFSTPDWSISGVNVVLEILVRRLANEGFNTQLLITSKPEGAVLEHHPDVKYHILECANNTYHERWRALREYFDQIKPCIWVTGFDFEMTPLSPSLPAEVAIVGMIQSDDDMHYDHVNRLGRYWNIIVTVSTYLSQQVEAINPAFAPKIHLVHNGVELPSPDTIIMAANRRPLKIITTGRLDNYQKRVIDLPLIAQAMDRRNLDYRLTIVGDGEEREALERSLAPQIGAGRVSLPGRLSPQQIDRALSEHAVFLLCSAFEGMPLSLLEGMARGLVPLVSAIKSGVPEVVHDRENGFIVPIGDAEAFADRVAELDRDQDLCVEMAMAARATVVDGGFDAATMADGYARVLLTAGAEILRGDYIRPKPFCDRAEFGRISLPPWLQTHPDLRSN